MTHQDQRIWIWCRLILWTIASTLSIMLIGAAGAQGGPPPSPVRVDKVMSEELAPMHLVTGDLHAPRRSRIATREPGLVSEMPFEVGTRVKTGDILARLDHSRLLIHINQNAATRLTSEAKRDEDQAALKKLLEEEERIRSAYEAGASSVKEMQDILGEIEIAEARLAGSVRSLEAIDIDKELLDQRVKDMTITAPFSGVILTRLTEVGEWVGQGGAIAEIMATDTVEAWMRVPQDSFEMISGPDAQMIIHVPATGKNLETTSLRILPEVDSDARSFTVIVSFDNTSGALAAGMSVIGWVPLARKASFLTVHKDAVTKGDLGDFVFVVRSLDGGSSIAMPIRVRTRFPHGHRFAVETAELHAGDQVIIEGNERLFPGAPVRIVTDKDVGPEHMTDKGSAA